VSILSTYRVCPNCGAGIGKKRLWFNLWLLSEWDCLSCSARLGVNPSRRFVVAIVGGALSGLAMVNLLNDEWLWATVFLISFILVLRFDSVRLVGVEETSNAGE